MKAELELSLFFQDLISQGVENEIVEFKEAKNQFHFDDIGKYFSALCNEANLNAKSNAWLIFGVEDKNKNIVGTSFRCKKEDLNSLKLEIANHTTGRLTFIEIYEMVIESKRILMFKIPAAPKGIPIAWKGHYYGRDGASLNALNIEEVERIREQTKKEDWSSIIIPNANIEDLSPEAILKARELYKRKFSHLVNEIDLWDDLTFLNKAKVCIKGKVTNSAILLLGKPESEHLLSPAIAKISWILRDKDNFEKDYQHFSCPFLLNSEAVFKKIRNLKYRYITENTLFPEEVDQYDPYVIREALNNCIAHQDYKLGGKINVVEHEDGKLIFINVGKFIPRSIEDVIISDAPESTYRNPFLVEAMINLNMIDAIGSGIKRMFNFQRNKFFPLPDYDFENDIVKLTVFGKIIDLNYARKVASMPDLSLIEIISLDKVAKKKILSAEEIKKLKNKKLIEGRKPSFHISATVAKVTEEKADYIKQKGIDDQYCQKIILNYLTSFGEAQREDFEKILIEKLPDVLDLEQKRHKIKNILQKMKRKRMIKLGENRQWILDEINFNLDEV